MQLAKCCQYGKNAVIDAGLDQELTRAGQGCKQHDLTLADLSLTTGIASTLSRSESGQRRPTLEVLLPLARAYQVPLDELIGTPDADVPRVHALPFTQWRTYQPLTRRPCGLQRLWSLLLAPIDLPTLSGTPDADTTEARGVE